MINTTGNITLDPAQDPIEKHYTAAGRSAVDDQLKSSHLRDEPADPTLTFGEIDNFWETMYLRLETAIKDTGLAGVFSDPGKHELRDWLNRQVLNRRHLQKVQFLKLDGLGIHWDVPMSRDHAWEIMYNRLLAFNKEHGHCRVPYQWKEDKQLALWVLRQRKQYADGKMLSYREQLLKEIEFTWQVQDLYDAQWNDHYQELLGFYNRHGHFNVPGSEKKLVSWMERQRLQKKKKFLSEERETRLNNIQFIWDFTAVKKKNWEGRYKELCEFKQIHGHSFVPVNYKKNKSLGIWIALQRKLESKGKLPPEKIKKLDKLNFVWSRDTSGRLQSDLDSLWENHFEKLTDYYRKHGTCQVSLKIEPALQGWTVWQRKLYYEDKLSAQRIAKLNTISFPWSVNEGYWQKMYQLLLGFHEQFGHSRVPSQWPQNPRLATWVYRMKLLRHELSPEKTNLLNKLGFEWPIQKKVFVAWPFMYKRLLAFKQEFGHTRVPVYWERDPKLGKWVSRMRNESAKISQARCALLDAIGFEWRVVSKDKKKAAA
ncbi:helicase associated domain-containing protein [Daejeonella sp. JGW-45]|uniref:helicase associated domain-containing protein n=1 Tax=Daejeonella sp. JGW-45 TaxID=3034148 RepID=UPI0023ECBFDC|nr:helicase associated domain-containing protein [Daejeonella sp. JGW-45]